ncbi:hypothetical protein GCM10009839_58550 [Catenulispora yoronensis]|uniref:FxLD family lantipeptide n=1 Tax=Catenulispora yoronensis TaxID=450799 RepID=A0ABN2V1V3_9ACTN
MSDAQFSGSATALAERPGTTTPETDNLADFEKEFDIDLRVVVTHGHIMGDCDTSDGCGSTCSGSDSSCNSFTDNPG